MPIHKWLCAKCGKEFEKYWTGSQPVPKYCSRTCSVADTKANLAAGAGTRFQRGSIPHNYGTRKYLKFKCEGCNKACWRYTYSKGPKPRFCTKCRSQGEDHPNWKGGKPFLSKFGYVIVRTGIGKRQYEHQLVAERALGRHMEYDEHVHHLNAIKHDNRSENLLICSAGYHHMIERLMGKIYQLEYFAGMNHAEAIAEAKRMLRERQL